MKTLSVKEAAEKMGIPIMALYIGLREDKYPFGVAVKQEKEWSYYINRQRFELWMSGADLGGKP